MERDDVAVVAMSGSKWLWLLVAVDLQGDVE